MVVALYEYCKNTPLLVTLTFIQGHRISQEIEQFAYLKNSQFDEVAVWYK